ncbi:hypothetical protein GBAR_LOCUS18217 [Geodia barretti]|uniref:Fibronectin type-III domain-containing protein n=1 Tax=Geodia barretti TaxID=519541 RepID=A0AA35SN75_GEOBA|nr:hypothetical protein GBAR_LOCUS18217 [Geodia barretti]
MGDNQQGPCRQSSNKPISVDTTNTSVSIDKTKLRAYTTYSITVTAESDLSNSSHKSIPFIFTTQQNGSSVAPRNVRASFVNSTVISVQWDGLTPCTQVNGRVVKYRVRYTAERSGGEVGTEDKAGEWDLTGAELALNGLRPHTKLLY